ncbi:MAG: sigma 54-interacting transcriptional regulator [Candidatus Hydrogenedentes bacterium]|nr:sigma 54-interacting transcriptional regulator [Candidatus Hydrogenedentota bacterium]
MSDSKKQERQRPVESVSQLLNQNGFLKVLFETIPCGVLIVDRDQRVHAANNVVDRTFGGAATEIVDSRPGNALHCIHVYDGPNGCGSGEWCKTCRIRIAADQAVKGGRIYRDRTSVKVLVNGEVRELLLLISSAAVEFDDDTFALVIIENITEISGLHDRQEEAADGFAGIIGRNPRMRELFNTIREVAPVTAPVLIEGESGTGKELVAAAIHKEGPRRKGLFVPVNCSALPEGLLESELFGHVRGAFTGAVRDKKGRFELADGGTIFLDEIGELSPTIQVKLLRVLQEGAFERVGDEKTLHVDVRVVSATNKDMRREVATGRFRRDLFYRLCVVPILLPPLRDRRDDIPLLASHILKDETINSGRKDIMLSQEALDVLMKYDWPGNVRELQNTFLYALVKCKDDVLGIEHLPESVTGAHDQIARTRKQRRRKLNAHDVERALRQTNGNKARAAKLLGVGRATLYRFLSSC